MKTAAIYIRTSSEHQAEKASPEEQERDCQQVALDRGIVVVNVYRDVQRYRAGGRMVDPSGTRRDRPGLVSLFHDAAAGHFDTIIAWRLDRLYRGLRVMLYVHDVIKEHKLDVVLARETFDPRMAPIIAWLASEELESMRERMTMGALARLRAGKATTGQDRYGYKRVGESIVLVEEEAHWVRKIFSWYIARIPQSEIRRRLIEAGAPQKGGTRPRKIEWSRPVIQGILQAAYEYSHGIKVYTRAGERFEIPVEPIISMETYEQAKVVRESNRTYRARNIKRDYLLASLIHCDCGRRWNARTTKWRTKGKKRKGVTATYYCTQEHKEVQHPNCPRTIGQLVAEETVWTRVMDVLKTPEVLINGARLRVEDFQQRTAELQEERERVKGQLDSLGLERQWVITQARKGNLTEDDMRTQLDALDSQEVYLKRELSGLGLAQDLAGIEDWEAQTRSYLIEVRKGLQALQRPANTKEEQHEQFLVKRQIVAKLVERVEIGKERQLKVMFRLDVPTLLTSTSSEQSNDEKARLQFQSAGTYTRKRSFPLLRPCGACG